MKYSEFSFTGAHYTPLLSFTVATSLDVPISSVGKVDAKWNIRSIHAFYIGEISSMPHSLAVRHRMPFDMLARGIPNITHYKFFDSCDPSVIRATLWNPNFRSRITEGRRVSSITSAKKGFRFQSKFDSDMAQLRYRLGFNSIISRGEILTFCRNPAGMCRSSPRA